MSKPEYHGYARTMAHYREVRAGAYATALIELQPKTPTPLRLDDITDEAITAWAHGWVPVPSAYAWRWNQSAAKYQRRPQALHTSIWSGEQLCGLLVGKPSARQAGGGREVMNLHLVQGSPDGTHPLRGWILPIAITVAEQYGRSIAATILRLQTPLSGLTPLYQNWGFQIIRNGRKEFAERIIPT